MAAPDPTHAGGAVYRATPRAPQFLLVTARRQSQEWVLPKGHIEPGEAAEEAAVREVHEEAGVRAGIVQPLDDVRINLGGVDQVIRYFLMRATDDEGPRGSTRCF